MAATPPPPSPSSLRTPAAPRHGAGYDQYEPYPTRCSARIANQRASRVADKTPEPTCPSSPSKARSNQAARKRQTIEFAGNEMLSAPGKSAKSHTRNRTVASVPSIAFDNYDLSSRTSRSPNPRSRAPVNEALPTPAKTPSKRKLPSSDISSASRTLFPTHTSTRTKKSTPLSLESFEAPTSKEIQIYTDSRDKIPKAVTNMETPFNAKAEQSRSSSSTAAPKAGKRARKQAKAGEATMLFKKDDEHDPYETDSDDHESAEDDAIARAGGMTMIFRGKKVFNKFGESPDEGDDLGLFAARPDLLQDADLSSVKSLTRSSIRPRRLFAEATPKPTPKPRGPPLVPAEEEATDDEGHAEVESLPKDNSPYTPQSPEFPRAPGGTRNLRSAARYGGELDVTPTATALISENKRKRASPFDQWLRQKPTPDELASRSATPTKRDLRSGSPGAPAPKKTRSTRAGVESRSA